MISEAFRKAERSRRLTTKATNKQRGRLAVLARRAGVEAPQVRSAREASDAIRRLEANGQLGKQPIAPTDPSLFFSDDSGNLSRRDPRQIEVPGLRDASGDAS